MPADICGSRMTIGWIEEWVNNGRVREGLHFEGDEVSNGKINHESL